MKTANERQGLGRDGCPSRPQEFLKTPKLPRSAAHQVAVAAAAWPSGDSLRSRGRLGQPSLPCSLPSGRVFISSIIPGPELIRAAGVGVAGFL